MTQLPNPLVFPKPAHIIKSFSCQCSIAAGNHCHHFFVVFCHLMSLELETSVTSALQSTLNAIEALCAKNALESDEVQSFQNQFISDILDNIQVQYTLISVCVKTLMIMCRNGLTSSLWSTGRPGNLSCANS